MKFIRSWHLRESIRVLHRCQGCAIAPFYRLSKGFAMTGFRMVMLVVQRYWLRRWWKCISTVCSDSVTRGSDWGIEERYEPVLKMKKLSRKAWLDCASIEWSRLTCHLPKGSFYAFPSIESTGLSQWILSSYSILKKLRWFLGLLLERAVRALSVRAFLQAMSAF